MVCNTYNFFSTQHWQTSTHHRGLASIEVRRTRIARTTPRLLTVCAKQQKLQPPPNIASVSATSTFNEHVWLGQHLSRRPESEPGEPRGTHPITIFPKHVRQRTGMTKHTASPKRAMATARAKPVQQKTKFRSEILPYNDNAADKKDAMNTDTSIGGVGVNWTCYAEQGGQSGKWVWRTTEIFSPLKDARLASHTGL